MIRFTVQKRLFTSLVTAGMLVATAHLHAETAAPVSLTGASEVPQVVTAATGMVSIVILPNRTVSGSVDTSGMVPTIAHIHEAAVGKNGPPIITLVKKGDNVFTVPVDAKLSEAQYASYIAGNLYVNVHSVNFPNGEIRAQLPAKPMRMAY